MKGSKGSFSSRDEKEQIKEQKGSFCATAKGSFCARAQKEQNKEQTEQIKLKLEPVQQPAYVRHTQIIPYYHGAINTAPGGAGKSYTTMATIITYKYTLFVICPDEATWREYTEENNINAIIISYSKLIIKGKESSHGYLRKTFEGKYQVTEKFMDLLKTTQILLVYDESQYAKNAKNKTCSACHELSKAVVAINNGSRILALSATPADKEEFVESIIKLLGIISAEKLFRYELGKKTYNMDGYGYEQLYSFCHKINPTLAFKLRPLKLSAGSIKKSMYNLYTQIVVPTIGFTMPRPPINAKFIGMNKFYKMSKDETERITDALNIIKNVTNYDNGIIAYKADSMQTVIEYMKIIEVSKLPLFKRIIRDVLNYVPNSKVIMYVWYDITVDNLLKEFKEYNPLRCDGRVKKEVKTINRKLFQEPNLKHRLLIAKPTSFGTSISLHDKNNLGEKFPRFTFINPHFYFNFISQAAWRTYRVGTVSDTTVMLTYCQGTDEQNVMDALSKKGEVTRSCLAMVLDKDGENEDETEIEIETNVQSENDKFIFIDQWPHVMEN